MVRNVGWNSRMRALGSSLLVGALLVTVMAPAQGQDAVGTISYVQDGALWRMPADDPSAAVMFSDPDTVESAVQGLDGSLLLTDGDGLVVYYYSPSGQLMNQPFEPTPVADQTEIADLDLSPDNTMFAYTGITFCNPSGSVQFCRYSNINYVDGSDSSDIELFRPGAQDMSFYSSDDVLWIEDRQVLIHEVGSDEVEVWLDSCFDVDVCDGVAISPDGSVVAGLELGMVTVHEMTGPPPAPLGAEVCSIQLPNPGMAPFDLGWSPDSTGLVFRAGFEGGGVWRASGLGTESCEQVQDQLELIVPGAGSPSWSPVDFDSLSVGSGPVELVDGGRLDGGGNADPIAQAIATSGLLFDDGNADRVVLATADRFPDALAGAALAGDSAPILLTSGLGDLDPRVEAEIARVTGGEGVVLTLGGVAAVSDAAALQARQAAGDQPCPAPLPTSCRYAGTGREDTAAQIGATVLAENPGTAVLLARGDEFADAITGGAFAAAAGVPVLLTPPDSLNVQTEQFISDNDIQQVTVLGGTAAVDGATAGAVPAPDVRRVAGGERTETAALIATRLWGQTGGPQASGGVVLVNVRDADGWQTALAAAVVSARTGAPQLGVENPPTGLSAATVQALEDLGGPVMAFGNTELVSDDQLTAAATASSVRRAG